MLQRPHGSQEVAAAIVPSRLTTPAQPGEATQGAADMLSSGALQPRGGAIATAARGTLLGGSSNGRTADSDSASLGSNPSPPAKPMIRKPNKRLPPFLPLGSRPAHNFPLPREGRPPMMKFWPSIRVKVAFLTYASTCDRPAGKPGRPNGLAVVPCAEALRDMARHRLAPRRMSPIGEPKRR